MLARAGWLIVVWLITGFMTITAAVSYGELSGMFPKAGGQYVYLKEAYNPLAGFLYGWSFFAVIQTATIAAVGVAFSKFLAYLVPQVSEDLVAFTIGGLKISPAQLVSIGIDRLSHLHKYKRSKRRKTDSNNFYCNQTAELIWAYHFWFDHDERRSMGCKLEQMHGK